MTTSPPHVLMIEDNEQNAYLARYLLERAGFAVSVHTTGQAGLAAAGAECPQLVLLDIQLPDRDGYAVARELSRNPATRAIPVVAVSSFALPGEKARAFATGCVGYIEKPIQALNFVAQVRSFLRSAEEKKP